MRAQDIIKNKPYLIWYTKNYDNLNDEAVVEAVLNYGDWEDVKKLFKVMGIKQVAKVFKQYAFRPRTNYLPDVRNYFNLYFKKYA